MIEETRKAQDTALEEDPLSRDYGELQSQAEVKTIEVAIPGQDDLSQATCESSVEASRRIDHLEEVRHVFISANVNLALTVPTYSSRLINLRDIM